MDSMDATTPLVPKKLLFTAATPYATLSPSGANAAHAAKPIQPSQRFSPAVEQPAEPRPAPVVRYGLPQDPESYYTRFVRSDNVRRYGLLDISDSDESDEDDLVQGNSFGSRTGEAPQIAEISPVESMMERLKLHWQTAAEQRSAERSKRLQDVFLAADQELAGQLDRISEKIHRKQVEQKQADERQNTQQLQARTHQLQELQRSHDKAAAKQQEQVERLQRAAEAEAEAARRRHEEEEEARRRAEAKAAAEAAEAAARAAAANREQEEAAKQAEQAKAAANAAQAAAAAAAVKPKVMSAAHHCIRCAPQAKAFELEVEQRAKAIIDTLQPLIADDSCKKARRDIEKKMTVHVQQISATQDQVARKCADVYQLIASQQSLTWRQYALYMFATKVVRQADLVMLNNKAAFPLATVLVKVSTEFPELMDLAVHLLHRECCFSVPCSFVRRDEGSGAELSAMQLRRLLGYKELDDPNNAGGKMYESDDAFISRVEGIMFLYGAIVQVQESRNPHGLDCAWRWLARFLNAIPASRAAGKALIFFLRAAGYAMYVQYRGQFIKLLKCMYDEFLPELAKADEPDIQAVRTMLEHYLVHGQYKVEPEGRSMPRIDMSSMTRA